MCALAAVNRDPAEFDHPDEDSGQAMRQIAINHQALLHRIAGFHDLGTSHAYGTLRSNGKGATGRSGRSRTSPDAAATQHI